MTEYVNIDVDVSDEDMIRLIDIYVDQKLSYPSQMVYEKGKEERLPTDGLEKPLFKAVLNEIITEALMRAVDEQL